MNERVDFRTMRGLRLCSGGVFSFVGILGLFVSANCCAQSVVTGVVEMAEAEITESSGLTFSRRDPSCVWTHNDSGDSARLFAIDSRTGQATGQCTLQSVVAVDFEAMTSVPGGVFGDKPQLIVADCGDNQAKRQFITMYLFDEPDPHTHTRLAPGQWQSMRLKFEKGPVDCEAVWYDAAGSQLVLLAKSKLPWVGVYVVPMSHWPAGTTDVLGTVNQSAEEDQDGTVVARRISTIALSLATGADADPETGDIWIVNYWNLIRFVRGQSTTLAEQLASPPVISELPRWKQIEAVAVDADSRVWITTEGDLGTLKRPGLLGRLNFKSPQNE